MVNYDPAVLQKHANRLYLSARTTVFMGVVLGGALGGTGTWAVIQFSKASPTLWAYAPAVLGLICGFAVGRARTFTLRLRAQTVLCQMQIEANTRRAEVEREPNTAPT